jgi:radical SAM superfamily enzyme YgiQ (UPF0313 family)
LYFPIWLAYATGLLETQFSDVRLVDAVAKKWGRERTLSDIKDFDPDLLIVDTNFSSVRNDLPLALEAKRMTNENATVVITGPPTATQAETMLDNYDVDVVVRKEPDHTLLELAQTMAENKSIGKIQGISFCEDNTVVHNEDRPFLTADELDNLPFVSKTYAKHLTISDYWLDHVLNPMVQIMTSRGCPNRCTFCSWPQNLMGRTFRARSPVNIADEIEWISRNLPQVKEVFFEDDTFTLNKKRLSEFIEEVKKRDLEFVWSCQSRGNLDYETIREMKEIGCRLLDVGYESGSDEILKNIKKGTTTDGLREFSRNAKRANMMILADFVFGFPGETKETIGQTIAFIKEIKPNLLQIAVATPMPGTEFYDWVEQEGFLVETDMSKSIDELGFQKCIVSYPHLSDAELSEAVTKALKGYYLNISYVPIALRNILRKNGQYELLNMAHSAKSFLQNVA